MARKAFRGDIAAQERLARHNVRFVVSVAKQYQNRGVPLGDLVSEANAGLVRAADKYDPDVGVNANVGDHDASRTRGSATSGATAPDEERGEQQGRGHALGRDRDDKQTGLDRADQAAGEHGRQGRDNARRHQGDRD